MKKTVALKLFILAIPLLAAALLCACGKECDHTYTTTNVIEPTHEKQGRTMHYCLDCEYEYASDFVPPLGHTLYEEVHAPTCDEQGYVYHYCRCGYHYTDNFIAPLGHSFNVETVEPTCNQEGYKIADCNVCSLRYTYDVVPPLGHQMRADVSYVATCKQDGSTTFICEREECGFSYVGDYVFYSDTYTGAYVENKQVLAKGVDVSYYNHSRKDGKYQPLDWSAIKSAGIDYALLRLGYMGSGNVGKVDPVFEMNYVDARAAGLDLGAYIYSYAYTVEDARAEAEFVLSLLEGKTFEYPIYFDIEYSDEVIAEKQLTPQLLTDICVEFISILQEHGYYTALYTNNNWLNNHLQTSKVTTLFDIWYARYPNADKTVVVNEAQWDEEKYGKQMAMWQFSDTGQIEGVVFSDRFIKDEEGNNTDQPLPVSFDLNYCYKDYPTIIKSGSFNNFTAEGTEDAGDAVAF